MKIAFLIRGCVEGDMFELTHKGHWEVFEPESHLEENDFNMGKKKTSTSELSYSRILDESRGAHAGFLSILQTIVVKH